MRELLRVIFGPIPMLSWVLVSVGMAYAGPFGSYGVMEWWPRLVYWSSIVGLSIIMSIGLMETGQRWFAQYDYWRRSLVSGTVFALTYSAILQAINLWVFADSRDALPGFWEILGIVVFITVCLNFIIYLVRPQGIELVETSRFLKRLQPRTGRNLVRLVMQDHYVDVRTTEGAELVLMRFADAMSELKPYKGLQVHRSHWIAIDQVREVRREAGKTLAMMSDGEAVPISRKYRDAARAAGIL